MKKSRLWWLGMTKISLSCKIIPQKNRLRPPDADFYGIGPPGRVNGFLAISLIYLMVSFFFSKSMNFPYHYFSFQRSVFKLCSIKEEKKHNKQFLTYSFIKCLLGTTFMSFSFLYSQRQLWLNETLRPPLSNRIKAYATVGGSVKLCT